MSRATTRIGSVVVGEGRPKLCVPVLGATSAELRAAAEALAGSPAELAELRIDHFAALGDPDAVLAAIAAARSAVAVPILFTCRTKAEGGECEISTAGYERLIALAVSTGSIDAVDVELRTEAAALHRIVAAVQASGLPVVLSSHDFVGTPPAASLMELLHRQQSLGADVLKIAVTPTSAQDVLVLLDTTERFVRDHATRPVISMSMGGLGLVSRLAGEVFGSAVSFGAVGSASAPGQIDAGELADVLALVHRSLAG